MMQKKFLQYLILFSLIVIVGISACTNKSEFDVSPTKTEIKSIRITQTQVPSNTIVPSRTSTETPQDVVYFVIPTHILSYPTLTPTPVVLITSTPTPYPTFDANLIKSATPAKPAICPPGNPGFDLSVDCQDFECMNPVYGLIYEALENGVSFNQILSSVSNYKYCSSMVHLQELTGDDLPELIVNAPFYPYFEAITCQNGKYLSILKASSTGSSGPYIHTIEDLNLDGVPEIVYVTSESTGGNTVLDIVQWNGTKLISIIQASHGFDSNITSRYASGLYWFTSYPWWEITFLPYAMNCSAKIVIQDIDNNGTKEIMLDDDGPCHFDTLYNYGPWLGQKVTYTWNGDSFLFTSLVMDEPQYRFQALQEADRAFILREYDRAMELYDKVVNSQTLEMWSKEKMVYLRDVHDAEANGYISSSIIKPTTTLDEYQKLSAYARYRMMIIQLIAGNKQTALTSFQNLDQIYSEGNPGFAYAEMGRIYWQAIQNGMDYVAACQSVIDYAEDNPAVFNALGDNEHGEQSHEYEPKDVCPLDEMDVKLLQE